MSEPIITYRGVVYPWHCDQMGHMNVMWYAGKFDEATWNLFAQMGLTPAYLRASARGMAAVQQNTSYRRELQAGDTVAIGSVLLEMRDRVARFVHEMRDGDSGEIAAISALTAVHIDTQTRKPCAFAAEVRARALPLAGSYALPGER